MEGTGVTEGGWVGVGVEMISAIVVGVGDACTRVPVTGGLAVGSGVTLAISGPGAPGGITTMMVKIMPRRNARSDAPTMPPMIM